LKEFINIENVAAKGLEKLLQYEEAVEITQKQNFSAEKTKELFFYWL